MSNPLKIINSLGQSIWYDNLGRELLRSGSLKRLIENDGITGVTSNPTILLKAVSGQKIYDEDIHNKVDQGANVSAIYEHLALTDIREAADLLEPVFKKTEGLDGYVSLEVPPELAYERSKTVVEARRLFELADRPNLMIKVPATTQGIGAITELISLGVNVNATLIFSLDQYKAVAQAYLDGLSQWIERGEDPKKVASVASFFVSRVDTAVDERLKEFSGQASRSSCADLIGKIAIANATLAYEHYRGILDSKGWNTLEKHGARAQRVLWASTSAKDPEYPDTYYVDNLLWPGTVNTLPTSTLDAYRDHGDPSLRSAPDPVHARKIFEALNKEGLNIDLIMQRLLEAGVSSFADSFSELMAEIAGKRTRLLRGYGHRSASLGKLKKNVDEILQRLDTEKITEKIWDMRPELWTGSPNGQAEIAQRLGWLRVAEVMQGEIEKLQAFTQEIVTEGFTHVALIGMGGSSLAPEVFMRCFGSGEARLNLKVIDTTVPDAILDIERSVDLGKTLFIVSSKSGATVEVMSLFNYFYYRIRELAGASVGKHFIAITDPGTSLGKLAAEKKFRKIFLNPSDIGGRFSALSYFGLVPAALIGVNIPFLLVRAMQAMEGSGIDAPALESPAAWLGAIIAGGAMAGQDKLTFILSPPVEAFGCWLEQLLAESLGKDGKGVIPIVAESLGVPGVYRSDRIFVYIRVDGDSTHDKTISELERAGFPVVTLRMHGPYDIGREIFRWEFATAVAGEILGVNPFDQPNVQESKEITASTLKTYSSGGAIPTGNFLDVGDRDFAKKIQGFVSQVRSGDYVALCAFIRPSKGNRAELEKLRVALRDRYKVAATVGFGPRYLHSTGQMHKGGPNKGHFIVIISKDTEDFPVSKANYSFGFLKEAQALGDVEALRKRDRRVFEVRLKDESMLAKILEALR
ncbi:MAG: bifunctional transaldolase/phosoglucose isomerase [Pseudomonadota bacterium]